MEYFKVMVTVAEEGLIWKLLTETELAPDHVALQYLSSEINITEWKNRYLNLYNKWLKNEDDRMCQITDPINMEMINALVEVNSKVSDFKLYYWFDVDRDKYPDYTWKKCPLSNSDLVVLPENLHENNRKVSLMFPLVFP
ncbi:hypothetical protein [Pedobacter sp. UBA5917]|jgi:hypothetical protein|uniref:hypothetical protein n=1 Tax=Pedobacter sp. UBA5917 TaxID=1947061 RepID=UPI0025CEEC97|nr:hypothetical protein [Pedobacter sp. UBA5917]